MYVCICNALTDKEIAEICRDPKVRTVEDVFRALGAEQVCAKCSEEVEDLLAARKKGKT